MPFRPKRSDVTEMALTERPKITFSPNAPIILDRNAVSHPMTPRSWSSYKNVSIYELLTIWAISFHFASQRMPLAHHMTVHFFSFQELWHIRQIMRFKSLVHVCGILFQPTWDRPNHWTFSRVTLNSPVQLMFLLMFCLYIICFALCLYLHFYLFFVQRCDVCFINAVQCSVV